VLIYRWKGKQHKEYYRTLTLAREAKADRQRSDRRAPTSKRPFDEHALEWIASCQGRTIRGFDEDTRAAYKRALELYAIPHFRNTPLRDIDRQDLDELITKMQRQGLSAASISKYLAPVRAMFSDAVESGELSVNPATRMRINAKAGSYEDERDERVKTLTRAELDALLNAIPERHRLAFEIMSGTGCRISEALGGDWPDVDFVAGTIRIERQWYRGKLKPNPKTEAGRRTISLSPGLQAKLWELGADRIGPILCTKPGQRLVDRNLRRILDRAAASVGLEGVTPHTLRHTHGSLLLDEGWTIAEVSERLGHADPAITARVYSHKMRDRRRDLGFLDQLTTTDHEAPIGDDD